MFVKITETYRDLQLKRLIQFFAIDSIKKLQSYELIKFKPYSHDNQ